MRDIWTKTRKTSVIQGRLPLYVFLLLILLVGSAWDLFKERPVAVQAEDAVILGEEEMIELSTREGGETIEVLAKVDTGAGYSSIDEDLAKDLGIDLDDPEDTVKIDSANGVKRRPLVPVRIKVAGKTLDTRVTVADRSELSKVALLGSRDLDGFLIKPNAEQLTSPDNPETPLPAE